VLNVLRKFYIFIFLISCFAIAANAYAREDKNKKDNSGLEKEIKQVEQNIAQDKAKHEALSKKNAALEAEIGKIQSDMVKAAQKTQQQEETINKLEDNLGKLEEKKSKALDILLKDDKNMSKLLGALLRLKRQPPQAMLALPQSPVETAESIILLKAMIPKLSEDANDLKNELTEIAAIQENIEQKKSEVGKQKIELTKRQENLASLVKKRKTAQSEVSAEQEATEKHIAELAAKAEDLRDLFAKLEAERKARLAQGKGRTLPKIKKEALAKEVGLPAKGKIAVNYGETNDLGTPSRGVEIVTRPGAQIITPYSGEVVFAGPFRSYGLLLIIEHREGLHIMMSGLGRIDAALGQEVVAGEPVGIMAAATDQPKLYVEYRQNGQPVHPNEWVKASRGK
jgi:septal ring factor EnvC (AmiA/AmiB activator)